MKNICGVLFFFLAFLLGCKTDPLLKTACGESIEISEKLYRNGPNDAYSIDSITIDGNCIEMSYFYGGGCGTTTMKLYDLGDHFQSADKLFTRKLRFSFEDRDNCKAYIKTSTTFDLSPLQKNNTSPLLLEIDGWPHQLLYYF